MIYELKGKQWKEFFLEELGDIKSGKDIAKKDMKEGNIPYISATSMKNGINDFISNKNSSLESKCISINRTGSVGYAFYHNYDALFSNNCRKFKLKENNNKYISLFIANQIKQQKEKYSYGYILGTDRLKRQKIMLPVDNKGNPDYNFMSNFMKKIEKERILKYKNYLEILKSSNDEKTISDLSSVEWKEFNLHDLFQDIQRGKRLIRNNFINGDVPYISSSSLFNGVDSFIGNKKNVRIFDNCLTLANSGSVGSTFYHNYSFIASDHVTHLKNSDFNKYVYLFIATMIKRLSEKYNFNREINDQRLKRETIILPVDNNGNPDYEYMEQYMINIEIKLLEKYLKHIENN